MDRLQSGCGLAGWSGPGCARLAGCWLVRSSGLDTVRPELAGADSRTLTRSVVSVRWAGGLPVAHRSASRWPRSHGVRLGSFRSRSAGGGSRYVHPHFVGSYATRPPLRTFVTPFWAQPFFLAGVGSSSRGHGVIFFPFAVIYFHPGVLVLPGGSGCYASGLQVINFVYGYVSPLNSESVRFVCILYPN
jgi:hypothetical protein